MNKPTFRFLALCLSLLPSLRASEVDAAPGSPQTPFVLEAAGKVEYRAPGQVPWSPVTVGQTLQLGASLRTGLRSRAALRMSELSVLRVKQLTLMEIALPPEGGGTPQLDLRSGASYFFSREPAGETPFRTPGASGAIRGTEFNLAVEANGRTVVTLLDGEVELSNEIDRIVLQSGEQGIVDVGQAPRKSATLNATNIIQWTLYYPGVVDLEELRLEAGEAQALGASMAAYRSGDLVGALEAYPEGREPGSDAERIYVGALLLATGDVEGTEQQLEGLGTRERTVLALRKVIAAVKFETWNVRGGSDSASELLADSYYWQSRSDLDAALRSARMATVRSAGFGFAWARLAELEFSFGRTAEAREALERGLRLSPRNAQAQALQGFLLAAQSEWRLSEGAFEKAIEMDGALGNAWLGRGLLRIRRGNAMAGRDDLQVAAALEPNRSVLRSYLGKAFAHIGDDPRARKELDLARRLDPNDPTVWLYLALLNQQQSRLNDAVEDLERSQDLNGNRAVYRSQLLLDQDQAVRSANLASIYRDEGMLDLSRREAARAVSYDYANYSAHLFLANSFDSLRDPKLINLRYETPWFSELLLANLLAPVGAGNLSQTVSQQEYSSLFAGDHFGVFSRTEYLTSGEWRQQGSQYGVVGNTGYSIDAFYRTDPGQRSNNDQEILALSAKVKQQLTPSDSVFFMAQYASIRSGDVSQQYNQRGDPAFGQPPFDTSLRVKEIQDPNAFLGFHHQWGPGVHTLFLGGRLQDELRLRSRNLAVFTSVPPFFFTNPTDLKYERELEAYTAELQQIWTKGAQTLVAGGRFQAGETETSSTTSLPDLPPQEVDADLKRYSVYGYYYLQVLERLRLIGGVSYDRLEYPENIDVQPPITSGEKSKDQVSPKAGFYLTPFKHTTIRGLYTRSLGGVFYDTSVRLEPTQIAGFNQAFRSVIPESVVGLVPGSEFETFGLALDQEFSTRTYVSVSGEILNSEASRGVGLNQSVTAAPGAPATFAPTVTPERLDFQERTIAVTVNQLVGKIWALGGSYRYTQAELERSFDQFAFLDQAPEAYLHQINLFANVNLPCGFFASWESVWSQQSNRHYTPDQPGADFWQHSVYSGYRFFDRRGEVRVGLLNMFDRDYRLNPLTLYSELPRERTLAVSLKLYF